MSLDVARLDAQMAFLTEADRLKTIIRATTLCDASRFENSAEHSWHLTLYALVLGDHAPDDVSVDRVVKMLILHDLVEIDAGDVPIHGEGIDHAAIEAKEQRAADRIFGLLPADQGAELRAIWQEFEDAKTPDALFAKALDRFQPPNQNLASNGAGWQEHAVTLDKIKARVAPPIKRGAPQFWDWIVPKLTAWFASR
mgnify:CR=1 FL=1